MERIDGIEKGCCPPQMKINKTLMATALIALFCMPWIVYALTVKPADVLDEVRSLRMELKASQAELEDELLQRTTDRVYRAEIEQLIHANNLKRPPEWD